MNVLPEDANRILAEKLFAAVRLEQLEDAEKYLCLGADPNYMMLNGHTSFHLAAGCERSERFINLMLKYDGNANVRNADGLTPLHIAMSWGKIDSVKLLIQNGADVHVLDEEGRDLKEFAELEGSPDCIDYAESLLSSTDLPNTPKSTKVNVASQGLEMYKENKNPNSPSCKHEIFNIRSPLNDTCDDSWIVKSRRSLRRNRKNATSVYSQTSALTNVETKPNSLRKEDNRLPTDAATSESTLYRVYSPRSSHTATYSPRMEACLKQQTLLHHPSCGDLDISDKCVGVSILQRPLRNHEQYDFNTTDKCIGTSTFTVLPGLLDSGSVHKSFETSISSDHYLPDGTSKCTETCLVTKTAIKDDNLIETSPKKITPVHQKSETNYLCVGTDSMITLSGETDKYIDTVLTSDYSGHVSKLLKNASKDTLPDICTSQTNQQFNTGLPVRQSGDALSPENSAKYAVAGSKSRSIAMETDQMPYAADMPKKIVGFNAMPPRQTSILDFDSTQTLPIATIEVSSADQNKRDDDSSLHARNMLLSTKVPLPKALVAEFLGDNFVSMPRKVTHSPNSPGHRTLNLMKFIKPNTSNNASTSKPSSAHNMSSNAHQSKHDIIQRSTHPVTISANPDLKHINISLLPHGKSPLNCSQTQSKSSSMEKKTSSVRNVPCISSSSQNITAVKNLTVPPEQASPCTHDEETHLGLNIRQFAAMSLSERSASISIPAPQKSRERFHSTTLHQSSSDLDFAEDISWDISIIKAESPCEPHSVETQPLNQPASGTCTFVNPCAADENSQRDLSSNTTIIYNWKSYWQGEPIPESVKSRRKKHKTPDKNCAVKGKESSLVMADLNKLSNNEIRDKLVALGETPGPILAGREIYLKKLKSLIKAQERGDLQQSNASPKPQFTAEPRFSPELEKYVMGNPLPDSVKEDDNTIRLQFEQPDPNLSWREGTAKSSFTYLLLDPRVTNELPIRAKSLTHTQTFRAFIGAIFYVGKGKESRPFHHFSEALQVKLKPSHKVQHIRSIWNSGLGVVALHVYQNTIACEAYTREAAMIDAVGLGHLTNCKRGEYYGEASSWTLRRKREYGSFLVEKALKVLMVEGERQIKPRFEINRQRRQSESDSGRKRKNGDDEENFGRLKDVNSDTSARIEERSSSSSSVYARRKRRKKHRINSGDSSSSRDYGGRCCDCKRRIARKRRSRKSNQNQKRRKKRSKHPRNCSSSAESRTVTKRRRKHAPMKTNTNRSSTPDDIIAHSRQSESARSRSRSRSIPLNPRRKSPSHLEARRITSARKRPIEYDRKWTSSDESSDTPSPTRTARQYYSSDESEFLYSTSSLTSDSG